MPENFQMQQQRFAVIDIGTNTFHLLIAQPGENGRMLTEIFRNRYFIKLAEHGIDTLSPSALERGMQALQTFRQQIDGHGIPPERVVALGTAALRTASNGADFRATVREQTQIDIRIISGDEEALLIARGALMAIPAPDEKVLIMDIGGGSVEFIIADRQQLYWAQSFPVGVAVLYRRFHHHEPILAREVDAVCTFLQQQLQPLMAALAAHPCRHLVGAAGTFDVLADQLADEKTDLPYALVDLSKFEAFYQKIRNTTRQQRYRMPEIPDDRADMIVVALILIELILQAAGIDRLTVSYYSMKEGMMAAMLERTQVR